MSQDRTCVSRQTCQLDVITGPGLSERDSFVILDTCGRDDAQPVLNFFPNSGKLVSVGHSGAMVSWGAVELTSRGGQYRLCWCMGSLDRRGARHEALLALRTGPKRVPNATDNESVLV